MKIGFTFYILVLFQKFCALWVDTVDTITLPNILSRKF